MSRQELPVVIQREVEVMPAVRERSSVLLTPVMDVNTAMKRLEEFQTFCANYLQESKDGGADGGDYGVIPGAGKKKVLMKSGADKLCEVYGLYDEYVFETKVEDWDRGLFDYDIKCVLKSRRDDSMVGSGLGACSSYESKYRWRDSSRKCPKCDGAFIIKGRDEYGGGWLCHVKRGGCGQKYKDGDKSIEGQNTGRVQNDDIADCKNTVLKMAKKRAKIDAVIGVTRSSGIFTQDLDDFPMPQAPQKPEVERSTEERPLTRSGPQQAGESIQGGKPAGPVISTVVNRDPVTVAPVKAYKDTFDPAVIELAAQAEASMSPKVGTVPEGCVDVGQAANFAKSFKDALPSKFRKQADDIRHAWLKKQGIVDSLGEPTSKAIRKENFYEVREEAENYASGYSA